MAHLCRQTQEQHKSFWALYNSLDSQLVDGTCEYDRTRLRPTFIDEYVNAEWPSLSDRLSHPYDYLRPTSGARLKYLSLQSHTWIAQYLTSRLTPKQMDAIKNWFAIHSRKPWYKYCCGDVTSTHHNKLAPMVLYKQYLIYPCLNGEQQLVYDRLFEACRDGLAMCLDANPGTGKTFLISALAQVLSPKWSTQYIVYTKNLSLDLADVKCLNTMTCCKFLMRTLQIPFSTACNLWNLKLDKFCDDLDENSFITNTYILFWVVRTIWSHLQRSVCKFLIIDEYTVLSPWFIVALLLVAKLYNFPILFIGDQFQQNSMNKSVHHQFNNYLLLRRLLPPAQLLTMSISMRQSADMQFQLKIAQITNMLQQLSRGNDLRLSYDLKYKIFELFIDKFLLLEDYSALYLAQYHRLIKQRLKRCADSLMPQASPPPTMSTAINVQNPIKNNDKKNANDATKTTEAHKYISEYRYTRKIYRLIPTTTTGSTAAASNNFLSRRQQINGGRGENNEICFDDDHSGNNNNDTKCYRKSMLERTANLLYPLPFIETVYKYPANLMLVPALSYIYSNEHGQQTTVKFVRRLTDNSILVTDYKSGRPFKVARTLVADTNHQTEHVKWLEHQISEFDQKDVLLQHKHERYKAQHGSIRIDYELYQFPLRMYATTYHGAQGLTLDVPKIELCIDAISLNSLYVGLTRIRRESQLGKLHSESLMDFVTTLYYDDDYYYKIAKKTFAVVGPGMLKRVLGTGAAAAEATNSGPGDLISAAVDNKQTTCERVKFQETVSVNRFNAKNNTNIKIFKRLYESKTTPDSTIDPTQITTALLTIAGIVEQRPTIINVSPELFNTKVVPITRLVFANHLRQPKP